MLVVGWSVGNIKPEPYKYRSFILLLNEIYLLSLVLYPFAVRENVSLAAV